MSKNKIGEDSPIPKFLYLKIQCRDGVEIFDDPWGGWVQGAHWWLHKGALDNILNFFHFGWIDLQIAKRIEKKFLLKVKKS